MDTINFSDVAFVFIYSPRNKGATLKYKYTHVA